SGWRSPSGAAEDRNRPGRGLSGRPAVVAVALRGGRGSQRQSRHRWPPRGGGGGRPPGRPRIATTASNSRPAAQAPTWRSPSGAAGQRNGVSTRSGGLSGPGWRSPSGAAEDRNRSKSDPFEYAEEWRSPSGAAEDRNSVVSVMVGGLLGVAVALRGG